MVRFPRLCFIVAVTFQIPIFGAYLIGFLVRRNLRAVEISSEDGSVRLARLIEAIVFTVFLLLTKLVFRKNLRIANLIDAFIMFLDLFIDSRWQIEVLLLLNASCYEATIYDHQKRSII